MTQKLIQKMRVVEACPLGDDIIKLMLKPTEPFKYRAGQYVLLGLEEQDLRPFSMACSPRTDGLLEFHIRFLPENEWMADMFDVVEGDSLYVDGPKDQYKIDPQMGLSSIFIAGGTGFAPMKALLESLLANNNQQIIEFYWGARQASDLYAHQEMLELCQQHELLNYIPVVSEGGFSGQKGLVHQTVLSNHPDLSKSRVYLCGSWAMQEAAKVDFLAAGLKEEHFN